MNLFARKRTLSSPQESDHQLAWIDLMKGVALLWVFLNHCTDQVPGPQFFAYPIADWSTFAERIRQLTPISGYGVWNLLVNAYRYVGWTGEIGVQLFLILSGFGLTWGLLKKGQQAPLPVFQFYRRRAERVYPLWWTLHILVFFPLLFAGRLNPDESSFWLSLIGFRATPDLMFFLNPAWWYVGLLIQLYLVYPFLWNILQRKGPLWLVVVSFAVAFIVRGAGLFVFKGFLPAWSMGAIFITRLPEFVLGIALASWSWKSPDILDHRLRSWRMIAASMLLFSVGVVCAVDLLGMTFALFLLGAGAFGLLYAPLRRLSMTGSIFQRSLKWIGRHSYSLFLIHSFFVWVLLPKVQTIDIGRIAVLIVVAFVLSALASVMVEWLVDFIMLLSKRLLSAIGGLKFALTACFIFLILPLSLVAGEFLVRDVDPQEVLGWGERPSLMADATLGWRLIPNRTTRLRWESYDYVVTANKLGFPGPVYPEQKEPGTLRILTTGDAFTSAEGVNTDQAWPRLLEKKMREKLAPRNVEVLNFGITGYGPQQYSSIVDTFARTFHPDIIIVEMFVNDYEDVLVNVSESRKGIGFDQPLQDGWRSYVRLSQLRRYTLQELVEPLAAEILSRPSFLNGYFLGNFAALERHGVLSGVEPYKRVQRCLQHIKCVSDSLGAKVMVAMVPASVQVCDPAQLDYYPRNVNLADTAEFDIDLPQRMTREITDSLGVKYFDLRSIFGSKGPACVYQKRNMHWTVAGHEIAADGLAELLVRDPYFISRDRGK